MNLSRKRALALFVFLISGIVAFLYLTAFAGILLVAYYTGEVVIKGDSLMLAESIVLVASSICIGSVVVHNLTAITSQIHIKREEKEFRDRRC